MLEHRALAVRRHDRELERRADVLHTRLVRARHRALVERPDLAVLAVGGDEALRRAHVFEHDDAIAPDPVAIEPRGVRAEVGADRGEDQRIGAEHAQVIGDVGGDAAEVCIEARDVERDVQRVHLIRQDVVREAVRKHHDVIERDGAGHQDGHARTSRSRAF